MALTNTKGKKGDELERGDDIVIIINDQQFQRMVKVSFDLTCNNIVHTFKTCAEAIPLLKEKENSKSIKAIMSLAAKNDYSFNDMLEMVHHSVPRIQLIHIVETAKDAEQSPLKKYHYIHPYSKEQLLADFNKIIEKDFGLNISQSDDNYIKIDIQTLKFIDGLEKNVFIRSNSTGHYSALFRRGSVLQPDEVEIYKKKGLTHVYIEKETVKEIAPQIESQRTFFATFSGFKFVLRSSNDPLEKRFEQKILRFQDELLLDPTFQQQIDSAVEKTLTYLQTKPKAANFFKAMGGLKNKDRYLPEHIMILCYLTCTWSFKLGWHSKGTKDKLVFAAVLHDITLSGHPHLAPIHNLQEFKKKSGELSAKEKELYLSHPEDAAKVIANYFPEIPQDTADIIVQHHERPDGSGFPKKINFTKISPLSMLFILAHDFTENFLEKDNYGLKDFLNEAPNRYPQQNFRKMIKSIGG